MKLFEGPGLIIALMIVLIIFGPTKLPELGKSLGKAVKSIRDGMEGTDEEPMETGSNDPKAADAPQDA